MGPKIEAILKAALPGAQVSSETDDEGVTTYVARDGLTVGVDVKLEGNKALVDWSTKVGMIATFVILGLSFVLMWLFGDAVLIALGLMADAGAVSVTLKLFYMIPLVMFLIPLGIVWALLSRVVAPTDTALLGRIVEQLAGLGLDASIDGDDESQ